MASALARTPRAVLRARTLLPVRRRKGIKNLPRDSAHGGCTDRAYQPAEPLRCEARLVAPRCLLEPEE